MSNTKTINTLQVKVDGTYYKVIHEFSLSLSGWELGIKGYVVEKDGVPELVRSSHGYLHFESRKYLEELIDELEESVESMHHAVDLLIGIDHGPTR